MDSVDHHLDTLKAYIATVATLHSDLQHMVGSAKLNFGADERRRVMELLGRSQTDGDFLATINKLLEAQMTVQQQETLEELSKKLVEVRSGVLRLTGELERLVIACLAAE